MLEGARHLAARATCSAASARRPSKYASAAPSSACAMRASGTSRSPSASAGVWMHVRVPPARVESPPGILGRSLAPAAQQLQVQRRYPS